MDEKLLVTVIGIEDARYLSIKLDEENLVMIFFTEDEKRDFLMKVVLPLLTKKRAKLDATVYGESALLEFVNLEGKIAVKVSRTVLTKVNGCFKREKRFFERETTLVELKQISDTLVGE